MHFSKNDFLVRICVLNFKGQTLKTQVYPSEVLNCRGWDGYLGWLVIQTVLTKYNVTEGVPGSLVCCIDVMYIYSLQRTVDFQKAISISHLCYGHPGLLK